MNWRAPRNRLRDVVEKLTKTRIFRDLPGGIDLGLDISRYLPRLNVEVVFDVGANVGQSAASYVRWFPEARIYCFEPASRPHRIITSKLGHEPRVQIFKVAMSSCEGSGTLFLQGRNDAMSSLEISAVVGDKPAEQIEMTTMNAFCAAQGISKINFLKIDAEGHDLEVLYGAQGLLDNQRIDLIQVEAGMNKGNRTHVAFEAFKEHLEASGYALFRMYEQVSERGAREPHLRRTNLVFCSRAVIEHNRQPPR